MTVLPLLGFLGFLLLGCFFTVAKLLAPEPFPAESETDACGPAMEGAGARLGRDTAVLALPQRVS